MRAANEVLMSASFRGWPRILARVIRPGKNGAHFYNRGVRAICIGLFLTAPSWADFVVNTLDGKPPLRGISLNANARTVSLASAEGPVVKIPTANVIEVVAVPQPQRPPVGSRPFEVRLVDGTKLRGVLEAGPDNFVRLRSPLLETPLDIDLERVLGVHRVDDQRIPGASLIARVRDDDVAYRLSGAKTRGTVERFTATGVVLARDLGPRTIKYSNLAAVFIDNTPTPALEGLHVVVRLADGSAIVLTRNFTVARGELSGQTPSGFPFRVETKHIAALGFMGGSFVHLSDMQPVIVRKPFFPLPEGPGGAAMLEFICPVRIDQSPDGRPITLHKRRYFKGIGVRPHTELTFRLDGKYSFFQTLFGIDDEIFLPGYGRGAGAGSVVFSVFGDGDKLLFLSPRVVGGKQPQSVRVDVTGMQTLKLVVALVPKERMPKGRKDSPELDNAVWARPLLIRKPARDR